MSSSADFIRHLLFGFIIAGILLLATGCVTRGEIEAAVWLNNGVPQDVCDREPVLKDHGFYRRLNDGKLEFISFCDPTATDWLSMHKTDYARILDATLPKKKVAGIRQAALGE